MKKSFLSSWAKPICGSPPVPPSIPPQAADHQARPTSWPDPAAQPAPSPSTEVCPCSLVFSARPPRPPLDFRSPTPLLAQQGPLRLPPPRSLTGGPPLSSLTPRRASAGLWESRPRTPAPPTRRGPHANGCARPFISGRHHPGADSQNPSRCRPAFLRRRTTQVRCRLGPPSQTPAGTHRRRREVHDVALHLLSPSPSPAQHRSAAASLDPSRPP
jgi:hypothetical protein